MAYPPAAGGAGAGGSDEPQVGAGCWPSPSVPFRPYSAPVISPATTKAARVQGRKGPSWRAAGRAVQVGRWLARVSLVKNEWSEQAQWVGAAG